MLTTSDNVTYTLGNLSSLTAAQGSYNLTLTAAGSGITDAAGNALAGNASTTWTVDTTAPTASITAVTPNPRNTAVSSLAITFSEAVSGVNLADLKLIRGSGSNLLTGSQTLTTSDNITYTLGNLSSLTATQGNYVLTLTTAGSRITDAAGNALAGNASTSWTVDTTAPTASITAVTPNPRNTAVSTMTIHFSEAVSGFGLSDLTLALNGGSNLLGGSQTLTTGDNITYTLGNLSSLTATQGSYVLTLTAAGSGITDAAGNALAGNASTSWTVDTTAPTASIPAVTPNPRNTAVSTMTVHFSEAVTGFDRTDLTLALNGGSNLLGGSQTLTTGDNITYTLGNLSSLTATQGSYVLTLTAAGSGITDAAGNALAGNASTSWTVDTTAPTASIPAVTPNPRNTAVSTMTVHFSEAVTGFDRTDLTLALNGGSNLLGGSQTLTTGDNITYTLGNLSSLTATQGSYSLKLTALGSGITDTAGNALAGDASTDWAMVVNHTPELQPIANVSMNEGSSMVVTATANDTDAGQTLRFSLDPGTPTGMAIDPVTGRLTWIPKDGPATAVVTVRVTDDGSPSLSDAKSFVVTVKNVAPTVSAGGDATINPGMPVSRIGSFADPGSDTWTASVDYGDGRGAQSLALNPDKTFALGHTYSSPGSFVVSVWVSDKDGAVGSGSFSVYVLPMPVIVRSVSVATVKVGTGKRTKKTTGLVLHFIGALNPSQAQSLTAYQLVMAGRDKTFGTKDDKNVKLASATYNALAYTVTLIPKQAFNKTQLQQLRIKSAFLSDSFGRPIDGNHDGQPGGDSISRFGPRPRASVTARTLGTLSALHGLPSIQNTPFRGRRLS